MDSKTIKLVNFRPSENKSLYDEFRNLQYKTFVREQGWEIPLDESGKAIVQSSADKDGYFTALIWRDELIGGMKAIPSLNGQVADAQLYPEILRQPLISSHISKIAVIKGATIISDFRQEKKSISALERRRRLFRRLTLEHSVYLLRNGIRVCILATGLTELAISMSKLGFRIVAPPLIYESPVKHVIGMCGILTQAVDNGKRKRSTPRMSEETPWLNDLDAMLVDTELKILDGKEAVKYFKDNLKSVQIITRQR